MRDLPIPGSPEISTTQPSPRFACSQRRRSRSTSSSRPTSGVVAVRSASNRLSTVLGRSAVQARTGPAMPLRSLAPRSCTRTDCPASLRVLSAMTTRVRLGKALQTRREVRRLADNAALLGLPRADQIADHHQAGGNANAGLQWRACVFRSPTASISSSPARTARSASSSWACG